MALTTQQIQSAYVTFFSRPADVAGLNYWSSYAGSEADLYTTFAQSKEYADLFDGKSNSQKVAAVYQNLFGRAPEAEGLNYWTLQLDKGAVTVASLALAVAGGAQGTDAETLGNRVSAATAFTQSLDTGAEILAYQGDAANTVAKQWLAGVTDNASLEAAVKEEALASTVAQMGGSNTGQTFTLTNGVDVATANVFNAARGWTPGGTDQVNTLDDDDVLTGTGTNPTLNFTFVNDADLGNVMITPTLNGVETVNVSVQGTGNKVLDLQDTTGLENINVSRVSAGSNFTAQNIAAASTSLSINNSNAVGSTITFDYLRSALAGTADETTLTLSNVNVANVVVEQNGATGVAADTGYETINLVSTGSANTITGLFQAEDLQTLNISGTQNLTIAGFGNAAGSLSRIDGSTAEGNLDLNLNGVLSATQDGTSGTNIALTVLTGAGADTIRVTNDSIGVTDSINTGEGTDTVILAANRSQNFTPATTGAALVTGAENLNVDRTAAGTGTVAVPVAQVANTLVVDMARFGGDQVTTLANLADQGTSTKVADVDEAAGSEGLATFVLANASAGDAAGLRITHSSTSNNGLGSNAIVLDVDAGVTTAGVEIREGNNADPRFNFSLNADSNLTFTAAGAIASGGADVTNAVVNVTLTDSDSESNSVALTQAARHTGTITLAGGTAGTFLNLDATSGGGAAAGGYGHVLTGAVGDATTAAAAVLETRDNAVDRVFTQGLVGDQLIVASSIAASGFAGNAEVRLGTSNTNAQLGSGDDTVIFADRDGITAATSGLSIQDTIAGGAGTDTIVLDGTGVMTLGASEWTNLSGVDVLRLAGVAGGTFNVRVTDQLVDQTDAGNRITIINNDGLLTADNELTANIDLRALSASNAVTFVGANSDRSATTVQTVILNDVTANGNNILNGGDNGTVSEYVLNGRNAAIALVPGVPAATFATQVAADAQYVIDRGLGLTGNNNILQIFNTAEVTVGDLANTSNFSTIQFRNDAASNQTLNLTLNDAVVDALVDANHTATANQTETLTINALDNVVLPTVLSAMNVQAGTVGAQFILNITGAGGADSIVGGAGADVLNGGAGNDTINGGLGDDVITGGAGADVMTGGLGADRFVIGATDSLNTALDTITDFTAGTDILDLAVVPTSLVAGALTAQFTTAVAVATTGATAVTLATDIATAVAAQIAIDATFWDSIGDTIAVQITGASVAGNNVTYIVQNQATDATYDAAADTVVALVGTSTVPTALASFA